MQLTDKQQRFCDEYLIDFNATRAYKVAYPATKSEKAAMSNAARLIRNDKVNAYLKEQKAKVQEKVQITREMVLLELAKVAFSNGTDYAKLVTKPVKQQVWNPETNQYDEVEVVDQVVELVDTDQLPADKKAAIASIKRTRNGNSIETCDKMKALELIGRHFGMFTDNFKVEEPNNPLKDFTTDELRKIIFGAKQQAD